MKAQQIAMVVCGALKAKVCLDVYQIQEWWDCVVMHFSDKFFLFFIKIYNRNFQLLFAS